MARNDATTNTGSVWHERFSVTSFANDVTAYLLSMPGVNAATVEGFLPHTVDGKTAQELVFDATKLDASDHAV